jgi:hypothetical protein
MKKNFSKRKFVYCSLENTDVPIENDEGCCEFYNESNCKCEYTKYSQRSGARRLSEREEIYTAFSSRDDDTE